MSESESSHGALEVGTPVVFIDRRGREHYDQLAPGATSNIRGNVVEHDPLVGRPDGSSTRARTGVIYHVFRATLKQHVLRMRRHAQIIYPKDLAMLLVWGDVYPGARVVEGGFGSGALTTALLRAVGPTGSVVTYENRPESVNRATKNVRALLGDCPNHTTRIGDIYDGILERDVDHVMLDVPEPWDALGPAAEALRPGGVLAAYVPTAVQLQRLVEPLQRSAAFACIESLETLLRKWVVKGKSVRPAQQMIGHTGFLVFARRTVATGS